MLLQEEADAQRQLEEVMQEVSHHDRRLDLLK